MDFRPTPFTIPSVTHRMLLQFHIQHRSILERPLHNIRFGRSTFHVLALVQFRPEVGEILQFDQVPDGGQGSFDDGGFNYGSGGGDSGRHGDLRIFFLLL